MSVSLNPLELGQYLPNAAREAVVSSVVPVAAPGLKIAGKGNLDLSYEELFMMRACLSVDTSTNTDWNPAIIVAVAGVCAAATLVVTEYIKTKNLPKEKETILERACIKEVSYITSLLNVSN